MWRRRYPYTAAGRVAAIPFTLAGLAAGRIAAFLVPGSPPWVFGVLLWAAIAGVVSYLTFSTQGATRPTSVLQASVADGLVAGVIASSTSSIVQLVGASGAGTAPSTLASFGAIAAAAGAGAVIGGGLGGVVYLLGGEERLKRDSGQKIGRKRSHGGANKKRRNARR